MKRAAYLCIATATLLLFGLPSAPLQANSLVSSKSGAGPSVVAPGSGPISGVPITPWSGGNGGGGGGGTDEGDADGLSGIKNRPPLAGSSVSGTEKTSVFLEMWWKFMILWAR